MGLMHFNEVELDGVLALNQIRARTLTQVEAGFLLEITVRHVRRLLNRIPKAGSCGN